MGVLPLGRLGLEKGAQCGAIIVRRIFPVGLDRTPAIAQTLFICIAVLRDQRGDPLRVAKGESEADRRTVVKNEKHIMGEAEDVGKTLDDLSQMIEFIAEAGSRRGVGEAEAG